jgi:serine/threonine-protein kinase
LDEAKALLAERGLKFVAGPDGVSNFIAVGRVIAQIPAPGVTLPKGSEVIVSVSTGQDLVEMPDVFGKTFDFVKFGLNAQGLKVGVITGNESRALLRAFINGKEIFVGDEVLRGATVDLTFA